VDSSDTIPPLHFEGESDEVEEFIRRRRGEILGHTDSSIVDQVLLTDEIIKELLRRRGVPIAYGQLSGMIFQVNSFNLQKAQSTNAV
jgi:hypothetical protein